MPDQHNPSGSAPTNAHEDTPSNVGSNQTAVHSGTPENKQGHINPSAPNDGNITPGTAGEK